MLDFPTGNNKFDSRFCQQAGPIREAIVYLTACHSGDLITVIEKSTCDVSSICALHKRFPACIAESALDWLTEIYPDLLPTCNELVPFSNVPPVRDPAKLERITVNESLHLNDDGILTNEASREIENGKTQHLLWQVMLRFGAASQHFREFHNRQRSEQQVRQLLLGGKDPDNVAQDARNLIKISNWCVEHFGVECWTSGPGGGIDHFAIEAFFQFKYEELQKKNALKPRKKQRGSHSLQNYLLSISHAERFMGLDSFSNKLVAAHLYAKEAKKKYQQPLNSACPLTPEDICVLEAAANGVYDALSPADCAACWCFLLLIYSSKRLANAQAFDFGELARVIAGERVNPIGDKSGSLDSKVFWIDRGEFLCMPWLDLGALPGYLPSGIRDYILPAPSHDYKTFLNKAAKPAQVSKWLERIWKLVGYSDHDAHTKRRVHALRKTLISFGADDCLPESHLQRLAGWKNLDMVAHYADRSKQMRLTKNTIIQNRRDDLFKKYGKQYKTESKVRIPMHKSKQMNKLMADRVYEQMALDLCQSRAPGLPTVQSTPHGLFYNTALTSLHV